MQVNLTRVAEKVQRYLPYVIIMVLTAMLFTKCENSQTQLATIKALTTENTNYHLKNGQLVVSANSLKAVNKKQALELMGNDKALKEMAKKFTNVKTITKYITKAHLDTVRIVYTDSIPCVFEKKGSIATKDYSLNYLSNQKGVSVSDLQIDDDITIVTGIKRKWFLGKETTTVDVTNTNQLVKIGVLEHTEVVRKKRFWDTALFKFGAGFVSAAIILK